jgi:hypothetical protein
MKNKGEVQWVRVEDTLDSIVQNPSTLKTRSAKSLRFLYRMANDFKGRYSSSPSVAKYVAEEYAIRHTKKPIEAL